MNNGPIIEYVPAHPRRTRGARFRVIVACTVLALICYFVQSTYPPVSGPGGTYTLLMLLFGTLSGAVAFLGFLFTGRVW